MNKTDKSARIILGIDPGTVIMGYGIISVVGEKISLVEMDVLKLNKFSDHHERLKKIFQAMSRIIKQHKPDSLAIEAPFFGKNVQSMLKLGRAQGVAITVAMMSNLDVTEYSPRKIKQSITGNGNSSKEQVAAMIKQILNLKELPQYFDETDAIAVALCHHFQNRSVKTVGAAYSGWNAFINANPSRVKK